MFFWIVSVLKTKCSIKNVFSATFVSLRNLKDDLPIESEIPKKAVIEHKNTFFG
jgi:hypothetical protein